MGPGAWGLTASGAFGAWGLGLGVLRLGFRALELWLFVTSGPKLLGGSALRRSGLGRFGLGAKRSVKSTYYIVFMTYYIPYIIYRKLYTIYYSLCTMYQYNIYIYMYIYISYYNSHIRHHVPHINYRIL